MMSCSSRTSRVMTSFIVRFLAVRNQPRPFPTGTRAGFSPTRPPGSFEERTLTYNARFLADPGSSERDLRLVMALKVRDEGDVIEANLRFHHALGVAHFVVTDNGSTDETPEILGRYVEAGLATVIEEPGTDYRVRGAGWLTQMARMAATDLGADWVIHTDADEFWLPVEGSLQRSEEHTSELQSRQYLVCRLLLEKKKNKL